MWSPTLSTPSCQTCSTPRSLSRARAFRFSKRERDHILIPRPENVETIWTFFLADAVEACFGPSVKNIAWVSDATWINIKLYQNWWILHRCKNLNFKFDERLRSLFLENWLIHLQNCHPFREWERGRKASSFISNVALRRLACVFTQKKSKFGIWKRKGGAGGQEKKGTNHDGRLSGRNKEKRELEWCWGGWAGRMVTRGTTRQVVTHKFITFPHASSYFMSKTNQDRPALLRGRRRREWISQLLRRARFYAREIY